MDNPDSVKAVVMQNCGHRQPTAKQKSLLPIRRGTAKELSVLLEHITLESSQVVRMAPNKKSGLTHLVDMCILTNVDARRLFSLEG